MTTESELPVHASVAPRSARELGLMVGSPVPPERLVTLANWQQPPWNRWAFQHVAELVPTARISRGDGPVLDLPSDPRSIDHVLCPATNGTSSTFGTLLEATYTDGFIALRRGRIVAERYLNGMTRHTRHLLQSVSKSLTGALAGALAGAGLLDPGSLVTDHVPALRGSSFEGATVRHVLDMTAGTKFSEDYEDPESDVRLYEAEAGWRPPEGRLDGGGLAGYIAALTNHRRHGDVFAYRSILSDLLGLVLQSAAGQSFAEAMSSHLWAGLGAEHDAEITVDRCGTPMADGGISLTLRDLARFGQLYLQDGCVGGRQVLPAEWIADTRYADDECRRAFLASEEATRALCPPLEPSCSPTGHYRNQWWVLDPRGGVMLGSGIYGQYLYVDASADVVLAKLSSLPEALDMTVAADTLNAFTAVSRALGDVG